MNYNRFHILSLLLLACSFLHFPFACACTVLSVHGDITDDGRPIFGKLRHPATLTQIQYVVRISTNPYFWYISVNNTMGVNGRGFATSNAASVVTATCDASSASIPLADDELNTITLQDDGLIQPLNTTSWFIDPATTTYTAGELFYSAMRGCATVDDFRGLVEEIYGYNNSYIRSNFAVIDVVGGASMYEFNQNIWWREYEAVNPNRVAQDTYGFVLRENSWHNQLDGTDKVCVTGDRYETGRVNLQGMLAENGHISVRTLARGTAGSNQGYEFFRYGPNRELAPIADERNRSAILVHGVLPDEDPALSTMWTALGPINYAIFVPTWVMIRTVPAVLGNNSTNMSVIALSLYNKGNEQITQQSTFPFEEHIFNEVLDVLLPHWRAFGTPSRDTMERVCHRIAADAYSLLHCLDLVRNDNKAPVVDFDILPDGMTLHFALNASDPDGEIESVLWNFGNNTTSTQSSPSYTYTTPGDYLISCTVTDNEGVSNTKWAYFQVPFSCDLTGDGQAGLGDLAFLAQRWLDPCGEPFWCDGADMNKSGRVDIMDFSIFAECW